MFNTSDAEASLCIRKLSITCKTRAGSVKVSSPNDDVPHTECSFVNVRMYKSFCLTLDCLIVD